MAYKNFFDGIDSKEVLIDRLRDKGKSHDRYCFYSTEEGLLKTVNNSSLRLTTGTDWNDRIDAKNLTNDGRVRFVKSFTYSKSENIAMWMLYSDPSEKGYMLSFSKSIIKKILEVDKISIKCNDEKPHIIEKPNFNIELIDVVYVGEGDIDNTYSLKKSIYGVKSFDAKLLDFDLNTDKYDYYAKSYGWAYENECRLVVDFDKSLLKVRNDDYSNCECYINFENKNKYTKLILFPNSDINSLNKDITKLHNDNNITIENSIYKGKINWSMREKFTKFLKTEVKNDD